MSYALLNLKSHYSLLLSTLIPSKLPNVLKEKGVTSCAITDYSTLSGTVQFYKALKPAGIKPILGETFNITLPDGTHEHLILLAKNKAGWLELIKLNSLSHSEDRFNKKPCLFIDDLKDYGSGNLIAISESIQTYFDIFRDDFRVGIYGFTKNVEKLRTFVKEKKLRAIMLANPHYHKGLEADHKILLATKLKTILSNLENRTEKEAPELLPFLYSNRFYIPDAEELKNYFTEDELRETAMVADSIEEFDITSTPILPNFDCPNNLSSDDYLVELAREGWKLRLSWKLKKSEPKYNEYANRVKYELDVIKDANLASYFLIVQDIVNFVKKNDWLAGFARGSAAGCLVSYLVNITSVDPLVYDLLFERFYNAGRKGSLPDIDIDIPITKRAETIDYIRNKYGHDKVGQMITFQTIKGKAAIKDVLRAYGTFSFDEINKITEHIEDEAKIADELQEMKEEEGESSIIKWALENKSEELKEWVHLDNGKISGPLALQFEQAIRLEGIKAAASKHAAGIIVTPVRLNEYAPMVWDAKTKTQIVGVEMNDAETMGLVKLDLLGIAACDKVMKICQELEDNYVI
jgi:DNA polymerase-3 subunit alpha